MSLIRISESSDGWIVDYDRERGMYRVSHSEDGIWYDDHWFDAYEDKEVPFIEKFMHDYAQAYVNGASGFMKYIKDYDDNASPIYPSKIEDMLIEFCKQFAEVREVTS